MIYPIGTYNLYNENRKLTWFYQNMPMIYNYKNHQIMRQSVAYKDIKSGYVYVISGKIAPANCSHKLETIKQAKEYIDKKINGT